MSSLSLLVLCLYLSAVLGDPCRQDWENFGESCYAFGEITVDWPEAQDICHSAGGKLAEIESAAENTFLKTQASHRNAGDYWIGGTDMFHEGVWTWISTGELIIFTDWASGQPDDHQGHQDCVYLTRNANFHWDDGGCDGEIYFICERPTEEPIVG